MNSTYHSTWFLTLFFQKSDSILVNYPPLTTLSGCLKWETSFGNNVKELNAKGVNVRFLKENVEFQAGGKNNPLQALLFNILGSFAQFERDIIVERTREGRERAKKQGKHLGRPGQDKKKIERALKLYHERETNGMSVKDISKLTGVPRSTIYHELKKVADRF